MSGSETNGEAKQPQSFSPWANWQRQKDAEHSLYLEGVRKALDIPMSPGFNNTTVNSAGIGAKGIFGIAMAAGLPGVLVAGAMLWSQMNQPKSEPAVTTPADPKTPEAKVIEKDFQVDPLKVEPPR